MLTDKILFNQIIEYGRECSDLKGIYQYQLLNYFDKSDKFLFGGNCISVLRSNDEEILIDPEVYVKLYDISNGKYIDNRFTMLLIPQNYEKLISKERYGKGMVPMYSIITSNNNYQ